MTRLMGARGVRGGIGQAFREPPRDRVVSVILSSGRCEGELAAVVASRKRYKFVHVRNFLPRR
jgi:hypothetical protein